VTLPGWLEPAAELPLPAKGPKLPRAFVRGQDATLRTLGVPEWQRWELIAIAAAETGWGSSAARQASNLGGQKVKADVAAWHRRRMGTPLRWFRAAGHVKSGDKPEVIYCAFDSDATYWRLAMERVFGTAVAAPWMERYREAARLLWAGSPEWFPALLAAGYRGSVTAAAPARSIASHRSIVARVRALLATSP
jgi:hypothetical protein